jgi:hypothetical protein
MRSDKFAFIVTHGRSGSTILQVLLNQALGGCVRGENRSILSGMRDSYEAALYAKFAVGRYANDPRSPWWGIGDVSSEELAASFRRTMLDCVIRPPSDCTFCGFKEIRYMPPFVPDLNTHLDFMSTVFPNALFIFNTREVETTVKSGWWPEQEGAAEALATMHQSIEEAHHSRQWNSILVRYEELVLAPTRVVNKIAHCLDLPEADPSVVEAIMAQKISSNTWKPST